MAMYSLFMAMSSCRRGSVSWGLGGGYFLGVLLWGKGEAAGFKDTSLCQLLLGTKKGRLAFW